MNRTAVYKTPQFILTLIGGWLLLAGLFAGVGQPDNSAVPSPSPNGNTTLKVTPSRQQPTSTIQQLQGAQGLQGQASGTLQQSNAAEQLQPNAETDTFTETDSVQ